ncbi:MAG TPA: hypothetical protein VGD45_29605 [Steroidobacter sp.]|uniref:hypothetical protein n=1 Tax=Steroidobacter sp. TaxID=1978227 RepID=UPI002ED926B4
MSDLQYHWPCVPFAAAAILACSSSFAGGAGNGNGNDEEEETPFDEARLFFELNHTDGDLGIHSLVDGDEWKRLEIEDPNDVTMLDVFVRGRLRRQGLTEVFFESAEPPFDELSPQRFFKRFPEGVYDFSGLTLDGQELDSEVTLSHILAAPPENIRISETPSAENCDVDPLPSVSAPVTISWDAVTRSHPAIGKRGAVEVEHYQLVLEREEPTLLVFSVELPPELTEFTIPNDFIALGDAFKFEIIVRATNGNQTAVESCFEIAAD